MKKLVITIIGLAFSSIALAAPPTYVEFDYITGGENNNRGNGTDKAGFEFAGSWGFNENWYVGGILGNYDAKGFADYGYLNANGGYMLPLNEKTSLIAEGGLWLGSTDYDGPQGDTDPWALEAKVGLNTMIADKVGLFGTFSLVGGDLDTSGNDDLSNFVWQLGGSYNINERISVLVKLVNGVNGVNGQDEVLKIAARWTF
jgi:hypothetical protein